MHALLGWLLKYLFSCLLVALAMNSPDIQACSKQQYGSVAAGSRLAAVLGALAARTPAFSSQGLPNNHCLAR